MGRKKRIDRIFKEGEGLTKRLCRVDFEKLGVQSGLSKSLCNQCWHLLTSKDFLTWKDVRFMNSWEEYDDGETYPARQAPATPIPRVPGLPSRASGQGSLFTSMRPRKVTMSKSNTLPELSQPLRANWNDRHHIHTHLGNSEEQALHLLGYVNVQAAERMKLRIAKKVQEMSTAEWIALNIPDREMDFDVDDYNND